MVESQTNILVALFRRDAENHINLVECTEKGFAFGHWNWQGKKVELLWNNWVQVSKPLCSTWEKLSECNGEQWQIALQRCALRVLLIMFRRIEVCRLKALEQYKVLIIYSLSVCRTNGIGVCCFELKYRRRSLLRRRVFDLAIIRFYRLVSSATKRAQGM